MIHFSIIINIQKETSAAMTARDEQVLNLVDKIYRMNGGNLRAV
jgi:hypothetical protein